MNFRIKILKSIVFLYFIFLSKQQETIGVYKVIENIEYAIVFDANEECFNVISPHNCFVYYKEKNERKSSIDNDDYLEPPLLLFKDKQNNYLLYSSYIIFYLGLNPDNEIMGFEDSSDFDIFGIFGYMSKEKLSSSTNGNTDSGQSEIIIYGSNNDILNFFYLKKYTHKKAKRDENFGDYLSCKIYKNDHFIIPLAISVYVHMIAKIVVMR